WGDGSGQWTRDNSQELAVSRWGGVTFASAAEIADIDGDGDLDLVVGSNTVDESAPGAGNWTGHYLQVLRNDGGRSFTDITPEFMFAQGYPKGKVSFPWAIQATDLNGDSRADLVVGSIDDWNPCEFARPAPAK